MAVEDGRAREVTASINKQARDEGTPIAVRHVCRACAERMRAVGVVQYVVSDLGQGEPVYATDLAAEQIAELQVTLGEGPAVDTLTEERPMIAVDLTMPSPWPMFAQAAVEAGVRAVFAFPLQMGSIAVGVLEIYRTVPGDFTTVEYRDALLYSDAAMSLLLEHVGDVPSSAEHNLFAGGFGSRWDLVHQATGVISVQLRSGLSEAFLRLRGHAFLTGRGLADIAEDVIEGRLRFDAEDC
ncbi:GAF and ANTAR domain-containing protein [Kutzneria sp. CA-103260]|uniref:GAF and ANTAR domain-containing protein n=1 Tax=Kutzneria sp. CA-103260 TaxID=2802641 RepID=UPI001BA844EF|nr:GAF and ANTAR domain-containing protein [Kutzneria sp. CA-103260]